MLKFHWLLITYKSLCVLGWAAEPTLTSLLGEDRGPEFEPCSRRNLLNCKRGSIAHSLSLSFAHLPDMTEMLLERAWNCKSSIYLFAFVQYLITSLEKHLSNANHSTNVSCFVPHDTSYHGIYAVFRCCVMLVH